MVDTSLLALHPAFSEDYVQLGNFRTSGGIRTIVQNSAGNYLALSNYPVRGWVLLELSGMDGSVLSGN